MNFPIPSRTNDLWIATGTIDRLGRRESVRNEPQWRKIGAERDASRVLAEQWRDAALADDWRMEQTYVHEDVNRACTLKLFLYPPAAFKVHIITRPNVLEGNDWTLGGGEVHAWGSDDLSMVVPIVYPGKQYFIDALSTCPHCHKGPNRSFFVDVAEMDTLPPREWSALRAPVAMCSYGFAGRACAECVPALRAKHERPGWND